MFNPHNGGAVALHGEGIDMFELFCLTFAGATALALWIANPARVSTSSHWRAVRRHNLKHDRNTSRTTVYPKIGV